MNAHELAKKLLEGEDLPVCLEDRDGDFVILSEDPITQYNNLAILRKKVFQQNGDWVENVTPIIVIQ